MWVSSMRSTLLLSLLCVVCAVGSACADDVKYVGAVAEIWPVEVDLRGVPQEAQWPMARAVLSSNLRLVEECVRNASEADIIVFPEDGLYNFDYFTTRESILPFLQRVNVSDVPCDYDDAEDGNEVFVMRELSCLARSSSKVIVVDIGEVVWCDAQNASCPNDGRFQYNTQVAFSANGTVLQKYRKSHLFPADLLVFDKPAHSSIKYFDTHFGVRFGMFICFDIFFRAPSRLAAAIEELHINDFVFSTYWVNEGTWPLISAIDIQQGWSRATGANLLASNIGLGGFDSGSGIYSNGHALSLIWNAQYNLTDNRVALAPLVTTGISTESDHLHHRLHAQRGELEVGSTAHGLSRTQQHPSGARIDGTALNVLGGGVERSAKSVWFRGDNDWKEYESSSSSASSVSSSGPMSPGSIPHNATLHFFTTHEQPEGMVELQHNELQCSIRWVVSAGVSQELYVAAAYSGPYFGGLLHAEMCVLAKCVGMSPQDCMHSLDYDASALFSHFSMSTNSYRPSVMLLHDGGDIGSPNDVEMTTDAAAAHDHTPRVGRTLTHIRSAPGVRDTVLSLVLYSEALTTQV